MSQHTLHTQTLEISGDVAARSSPESAVVSSSPSSGGLNAGASEYVPRPSPNEMQVPAAAVADSLPAITSGVGFTAGAPGESAEFHGDGGGDETDRSVVGKDGLGDDVVQRTVRQVEYYFSDANLATTEHLMRIISKDPEGYVPIGVVASFKKIKALIHSNSHLAMALRTSSKLVVSDDGKKVKRRQSFTEADVEEVQSRIVVAENLPEDHSYQHLMKIFSAVGSVKSIRTCYPQTPNGSTATSATGRSSKLDSLFGNRLHAFVEYDTVEDAEKAIMELNDKSWRYGLKLRVLNKCLTKHGQGRGKKGHADHNGENDASTASHPNEKHVEENHQLPEALHEHMGEDSSNEKDGPTKRVGKGRGRGGRGRGRGQHHNNSHGGVHTVGTPPSGHLVHSEQPVTHKQPPGPRMPDGTKGFTLGRGKPATSV